MGFKGSKGKWKVVHSESKTAFNVVGTVLGGKHKIARCPYVEYAGYPKASQADKNESEANAKLIAHAPELLDALQHTLEVLYECDCPQHLQETYGNLFANYNNLIKESTE